MSYESSVAHYFRGQGVALRLFSLVLSITLSSCAQLPSQSKIVAFGQAASDASTIFKDAAASNADLAKRTGEDDAVARFLADCPNPKDKPNCNRDYKIPTADYAHLANQALQPRLDLISALGTYADSLKAAADSQTIQDLEASATRLASTVGSDVAPLLGGAAIPLVSPAAKIVGQAVGWTVASDQAAEITEVMRRTHPSLEAAVRELKASFAIIKRNNETQLRSWRIAKIAVLSTVRDDPRVPKNVAEAEFRAANSEARILQANIAAMASFNDVLDCMVTAHAGLIASSTKQSADLNSFIALVNQLQGILSVIKR